jgi:hypothetical protein
VKKQAKAVGGIWGLAAVMVLIFGVWLGWL